MTNKKRVKALERRMIPPGAFMVVWKDPDKKGVYYDSPPGSQDRKTYTEQDIKPFQDDPNGILFVVSYADNPSGPGKSQKIPENPR